MEMLATMIASICVSGSLLSIVWLYRRHDTLKTPYGLYSVLIFAFALWHFIVTGEVLATHCTHEIVTGLFVMLSIAMNSFCAGYSQINLGVNRRENQQTEYHDGAERRHRPSEPVLRK